MKRIFLTLALVSIAYCSFAQWSTGSGANIFYNNGNVGIGTTTPSYSFDVNGIIRSTITSGSNLILSKSLGASIAFDNGAGTQTGMIEAGSNDNHLEFWTNTATNTGITERMRITNNGNVGIGTTSPTAGLDVWNGAVHVASGTGGNYAIDGAYIAWNTTDGGGGETNFVNNIGGGYAGGFTFDNTTRSNVVTRLMTILGNGNVGIGTTNPQGYKLAVNGSAIATSMTVKLYANWPDYVFKPEYHLSSLSEVKTYIDRNRRLPDMPSEAQVAKDGINLGDMNTLLTKKVEELTLYLIEQNKQIAAQQKQIDQLNEKFNTLTNTQN